MLILCFKINPTLNLDGRDEIEGRYKECMVRESHTSLRKPNEIIDRVIRLLCTMSIQHFFKLEHHGGGFRHFFV